MRAGSYDQVMAAARSAGILLHRVRQGRTEVLLVHPGGPLWARRDLGSWSIPKGELDADEDPLAAARREFAEELGTPLAADAPTLALGEVRQRSGKRVLAWAVAGDVDVDQVHSNTARVEWPPRSGRMLEVPEIDRAAWFELDEARRRINPAQVELLDRLSR